MYSGKDASDYIDCFQKVKDFIDQSQDDSKLELVRVQFPIFVCLYLIMIRKKFFTEAHSFLDNNKGLSGEFHPHHKQEIALLETVTD